MLCRSTLNAGILYASWFGVWTSSVSPIMEFTMNRSWWHGVLTPPRETAQSGSIPKDLASHFLQWTCLKRFTISIVWHKFDYDSGISTSRGHPCVAPSFLISFPNSSAAFIRVFTFDLIQFWPHVMYFHHKFYHCKVIGTEKFPSASWDYIEIITSRSMGYVLFIC